MAEGDVSEVRQDQRALRLMTAAYRPPPERMPPHRCPCGMLIPATRKRCPFCALRHVQDLRNARARRRTRGRMANR